MNRGKLKKLGLDLPLYPTTSVGSFPKPEELKQARNEYKKGALSREDLKKKEEEATVFWIKKQEERIRQWAEKLLRRMNAKPSLSPSA